MVALVGLALLTAACATLVPASPPVAAAVPKPTALPTDLYLSPEGIVLYPGPPLYSGDVVTLDVIPSNVGEMAPSDIAVQVARQAPGGAEVIAEGWVERPTFDDLPVARLVWVWDTAGMSGTQVLVVELDPQDVLHDGDEEPANNVVTLTVTLRPSTARPPAEIGAAWAVAAGNCCNLHYVSGTAAARDLVTISAAMEEAASEVQARLGVSMSAPLDVYLLDRIVGQGGYAQGALALSYVDRSYTGGDLATLARHEIAHVVDTSALAAAAPVMLREGLAVWTAGGHYQPEPLPERGRAMVDWGGYVPLTELVDDFYAQQHEIGYLEAGAFVSFLVDSYGQDDFLRFYAALDVAGETPAATLDAALRSHYGLGLAEVEPLFCRWLAAQPASPTQQQDLENTVYLFDTIRRYQQSYDPAVYFLHGWLPPLVEGEERGIVADFVRQPTAVENVALECMLVAADEARRAGDVARSTALLDEVNGVLASASFDGPLAADYLALVRLVAAAGSEVQRIEWGAGETRVWVTDGGTTLTVLTVERRADGWLLGE